MSCSVPPLLQQTLFCQGCGISPRSAAFSLINDLLPSRPCDSAVPLRRLSRVRIHGDAEPAAVPLVRFRCGTAALVTAYDSIVALRHLSPRATPWCQCGTGPFVRLDGDTVPLVPTYWSAQCRISHPWMTPRNLSSSRPYDCVVTPRHCSAQCRILQKN